MASTRTLSTFAPPIIEAKAWVSGTRLPDHLPLLDLSQAAPSTPPPAAMLDALAEAIKSEPDIHLYGPDLGNPELRAALADKTAKLYNGVVRPEQIAITSGCNQAYAAAMISLTDQGDEVIIPTPWYFNHKMWLDMSGVKAVPLHTGPDMLPDVNDARALISSRTRAILLVSPNNPTGVEYPSELIEQFYLLARECGIHLVLDETYRDFRVSDEPAHELFADPDWPEALIHLYSFSKSFHLTGHRVGALATSAARLNEIVKFIDTVTICPSGVGQKAAFWGLENLDDWLLEERAEILKRGTAIRSVFDDLADNGWVLKGSGAYFAYAEHPEAAIHQHPAQFLLSEAGVLILPASMFRPLDDPGNSTEFRIAFANIDEFGIQELGRRLADFSF